MDAIPQHYVECVEYEFSKLLTLCLCFIFEL
jgi:hypothetical protein